jgi:hypothetical protein
MFRGLINDAKSAASSVILKYVARASVAIPFLIAAGFAVAAITVMLVNSYGHVTAYWIMAGGLAVIGVVASLAVSVKEHGEEVADQQAEQADTSEMAAEVAKQAPLAMLGALFAMPGGGTAALKLAQVLGRNFPLVLLLVLIGALFWPSEPAAEVQEEVEPVEPLTTPSPAPSPDGFDRPSAGGAYTH